MPSKVRISWDVHELICGGSFTVRERGRIDVKNGQVATHIVEQ